MTSDLAELLARVEAAEGADRQIDHELSIALTQFGFHGEFTASLDAALALCEQVLPGWNCEVRKWHTGAGGADLYSANGVQGYHANAKTPPLALLAALLKAKIAQTEPTP